MCPKNFNVNLCIYWRCNNVALPDIQPHDAHIPSDCGNVCVFFRLLHAFHWDDTKQKFQHHHPDQRRFVIHHWISLSSSHPQSMTAFLYPTVTLFCYFSVFRWQWWLSFGFSVCKSHLLEAVSHSLVTDIKASFHSFVAHLFCCVFSVFRKHCLSFLSWLSLMSPLMSQYTSLLQLGPDFRNIWLGTSNIFCNILWCFRFSNPLCCFNHDSRLSACRNSSPRCANTIL